MEVIIKAAQFILSLSLLVLLHEAGHFIPAKLFKTKVEKFYLFFDPWFSLFKYKKGETEYGIGWLPLGGYVKIAGMIDESMDKEQMKQPAQPWEFRSKKTWQRLIIMIGGVTVNLIVAIVIYIGVMAVWGREYMEVQNLTYGVECDSIMEVVGFEDGDKFIEVNGQSADGVEYSRFAIDLLLGRVKEVKVQRGAQQVAIQIPDTLGHMVISSGQRSLFRPLTPFYADSVIAGRPGEAAGLLKGDKIVSLDGQATPFFTSFAKQMNTHSFGDKVVVGIERNGQSLQLDAVADTNDLGKGVLGISPLPFTKMPEHFTITKDEYTFLEAIPAGFKFSKYQLTNYVDQFKLVFTLAGIKQLGGPITMARMFKGQWDWHSFWTSTAFLSLILAFMNILPIPALDGGHVVFLLYEMVTKRKPHEKVLEYAQLAGIVLLLSVMVYAFGNDIFRVITGN